MTTEVKYKALLVSFALPHQGFVIVYKWVVLSYLFNKNGSPERKHEIHLQTIQIFQQFKILDNCGNWSQKCMKLNDDEKITRS